MSLNNDQLRGLAQRFATLTPSAQQAFIGKLTSMGLDFSLLPIVPAQAGSDGFVAAHAQERLWLLWRMAPESAAYNISGALRLTGELDIECLQAAFDAVLTRHEILHATFAEDAQGQLHQRHSTQPITLALTDLGVTDLSLTNPSPPAQPADRSTTRPPSQAIIAETWCVLAEAEADQGFDLENGPLLRIRLLRLGTQEHILLITLHHIIADGWSLDILSAELGNTYAAAITASTAKTTSTATDPAALDAALPPLAIQYADYAQWQKHWLGAGQSERELGYWRNQLAGEVPNLAWPHAGNTQAVSATGARLHLELPESLSQALHSLAREQDVTLYVLLLGVFKLLLFRYTGQTDLWVGTPVANRQRAEVQTLIGCFVNTQVIRSQLQPEQGFDTLLSQLRQTCLDAQAHQDLPYEQIVQSLQHSGQSALIQAVYSHQQQGHKPVLPGLAIDTLAVGRQDAKFELTLGTEEDSQGKLRAALIYRADVFSQDSMQRMRDHFHALLVAVVARPRAALRDYSLLSPAEHKALQQWNQTAPASAFVPLAQRISASSQTQADAPALIQDSLRYSYGRLERESNQLAHFLLSQVLPAHGVPGLPTEARIGVCLERSPRLFVTLLAILKAGGVYVPLDPALPNERLAWLQQDADLCLLLSESALLPGLPVQAGIARINLDQAPYLDGPAHPVDVTVQAQQLAYLIYTSGSTGLPKGVAVAHAALSMHMLAIGERYGMCPDDVLLHSIAISFDGASEAWLAPLAHGASLVITPQQMLTPTETNELIQREQVSIVGMSPAYLVQMAEAMAESGGSLPVRSYTVGGEAVTREHVALLRKHLLCHSPLGQHMRPARLINGYGPTETVVTPTLWIGDADTPESDWSDCAYLPIGNIVGQRSAHVLDEYLQEVAIGLPGELYLGGQGLARGYWQRPGLSADRFVPDPFTADGSRLYRTGDLVRRRMDGNLEYLGRLDQQVKIRGLRIELGEIETRLSAHPQVSEVAVVVSERDGDKTLVAYVCGSARISELKSLLEAQLPAWMVPPAWVALDTLPRLPSGKLNRQALPTPGLSQGQGLHRAMNRSINNDSFVQPYEAAIGVSEIMLEQLWQELLKQPRISRHDNFFESGGHSLLATRLLAKIRQQCGVNLPLKTVFATPILHAMAQQIDACRDMSAGPESVVSTAAWPIPKLARDRLLPLSAAQAEIWHWSRQHHDNPAYNMSGALRLTGTLNPMALQDSLNAVIARHEALRTGFVLDDSGQPGQRIQAGHVLALTCQDLSYLPTQAALSAAQAIAETEAATAFVLASDSLCRASLLKLAENDHVLLITLHHIIADGASMGLLLTGLVQGYRDQVMALPITVAGTAALQSHAVVAAQVSGAATPAFADWVAARNNWLAAGEGERQQRFWQHSLQGIRRGVSLRRHHVLSHQVFAQPAWPEPALVSPDTSSATMCSSEMPWNHQGQRQRFILPPELMASLKRQAQAEGASLAMSLFAAFAVLVQQVNGSRHFCLGMPVATRQHSDAEDLFGLLLNFLPIPVRVEPSMTFRQLLCQVRDTQLAIQAHPDLAYSEIAQSLESADSQKPLFYMLFNYLRPQVNVLHDLPGLTVTGLPTRTQHLAFELELDISEAENGDMTAALGWSETHLGQAQADHLQRHYLRVLTELAAGVDQHLSELLSVRPEKEMTFAAI